MSTIAAIATPAGRGGVGIIRISGEEAVEITQQLCQKEIALVPRHAHYHHWHDEDSSLIDSGVTLYFPAPHSYTGEDVIELQAHGSL